ncbi:MAG: DNA ligase D, partial [Bryobacteraceae bacterium]
IQRHHATNLHYDLRLEVDGVLKSWAVPKGPTQDPAIKRMAMMTEDHPMKYASFEGVIPKGQYGGGSMMLWDRGTYEALGDKTAEEQLARGDFKFRLHGEKARGEFAIVKMKSAKSRGNEWLLLKKKDADAETGWDPEEHAASVLTGRSQEEIARQLPPKEAFRPRDLSQLKGALRSPMPSAIEPMKAQLGDSNVLEKRSGPQDDWLYEVKWDGVRAVCYLDHGALKLVSRTGNAMDRQYPELSVLPRHVRAETAILDGEIAALNDRGLPSFELLQHRMHVADASAAATLARNKPVVLFLFDLLYLDGFDLRGVPLLERKRLLHEILTPDDRIRISEHFTGHGAELFAAAKEQGLEGVVAKRPQSFYESRRSADWVKYKAVTQQEFVICGYTSGERDLFGALVLGVYINSELKWAGNVGTGFDRKMMELIYNKLQPLIVKKPLFAIDKSIAAKTTWTRPELVCEVKFVQWTEDGRLRAPSFTGLRTDIAPEDCVREVPGVPATEPSPVTPSALLDPAKKEVTLTIDGHPLKFTNLDKIFWPVERYTKRDLISYYDAVSDLLLPHLRDRPLSLKRYPNGIDGEFFFQKEAAASFPKWLRLENADGINYVVADDRATLLFLANLACIDQNPGMSRIGSIEHPDYVLIDLDPQECAYSKIVEAALLVRKTLDALELEGFPKSTGGDGMHIYIPLEPVYTFEQARSFAEIIARLAAAARPDLFTTPRAVSKREAGRVYFDWAQIGSGKTISAPYVPRPHPGAPVATPLAWREVTARLDPKQFHIRNVLDRFARVGDLFAGVLSKPQRLESAIERLPALMK